MGLIGFIFGTGKKESVSEDDLVATSSLLEEKTKRVVKEHQEAYNRVTRAYNEVISLFKQLRGKSLQIIRLNNELQQKHGEEFSKGFKAARSQLARFQAEKRLLRTQLDVKLGFLGDHMVKLEAVSKALGNETRTIMNELLRKIADEIELSTENRKRLFPGWF